MKGGGSGAEGFCFALSLCQKLKKDSSPNLLTPISTLGGTHSSGCFFPGLRLPREDAGRFPAASEHASSVPPCMGSDDCSISDPWAKILLITPNWCYQRSSWHLTGSPLRTLTGSFSYNPSPHLMRRTASPEVDIPTREFRHAIAIHKFSNVLLVHWCTTCCLGVMVM